MCWLDWIFLAVNGIASRRSLHSLGRDDRDVISSSSVSLSFRAKPEGRSREICQSSRSPSTSVQSASQSHGWYMPNRLPAAQKAHVITLTAEKFEFELENVPADTANLKLVILASEPQSNGVTRAYSKAAGIIEPLTPEVETPVDLKASSTAKCGYPTEAAPRVFIKYFFVNTATGEKSGEMMKAVRLG